MSTIKLLKQGTRTTPTAEYETVTPATAQGWLDKPTKNRKLVARRVDLYAGVDMDDDDPANRAETYKTQLNAHTFDRPAGELTVDQPNVKCVWSALPRREWATSCGVSTGKFNSCHKFCGFCGRPIQWGS